MSDDYDEVEQIIQNANNEWELAYEEKSIQAYKSAEKLFLLAIKKTGEPLPRIHANLAQLYIEMQVVHNNNFGKNIQRQYIDLSEEQSAIALKYDPENLFAQYAKVKSSAYGVYIEKKHFSSEFKSKLEKLIFLFKKSLNESRLNPSEILFWAENFLDLGELCEQVNSILAKEIYSTICNISVDNMSDWHKGIYVKKEIRNIKQKAESRL